MNRSLIVVLGALAIGVALFCAAFAGGKHAYVMTCPTDDLSWLRTEFHLNDAQMARIRQLHEGYLPQCAKMCAMINAKQAEVQAALGGQTNVTTEAQRKLTELAELRARCQAQMLQHFITVCQAMPSEEGRRYLAEMEKITLGSHEKIEQSMSASHEHGAN